MIDPTIIVAPPPELALSSLTWKISNVSKASTFDSSMNPILGPRFHLWKALPLLIFLTFCSFDFSKGYFNT
jgi:hypothetical protein